MTDEKKRYFAEYKRKNLKNLQVCVRKELYVEIAEEAERNGLSVSAFVKQAVLEKMSRGQGDVSRRSEVEQTPYTGNIFKRQSNLEDVERQVMADPNGGVVAVFASGTGGGSIFGN